MRLALAFLACFAAQDRRPQQGNGVDVAKDAVDFKLKSLDGKSEVQLSKLKGKPVVLIFGSYT